MDYILLEAPMHVNWNYTYKCNFNCSHCYSRERVDMNELDYNKKMMVARNLVRNKVFNVNLGGGEPLLCDDCFDIIQYLSDNNVHVTLSTNGWKLSKEVVKRLQHAGLSQVSISIDNSDRRLHDDNRNQPNSWDEACKSVRMYVNAGIDVLISTVITKQNFKNLEDILKLGVSLGASVIDLKRLRTMGNAFYRRDLEINEIEREQLYRNLVAWKAKYPIKINLSYGSSFINGIDNGCPCGKTSLAIMCNGDISPCVYNVYKIGNAVQDDIHEIWCKSESLTYLRSHFSCMGLAKKEKNMFKLSRGVIMQKDHRIDRQMTVAEYLKNENKKSEVMESDMIAVVSIKGVPYGLNKTAAIVLEEIENGKSIEEIVFIFKALFDMSVEKANADVALFLDELIKMDAVTRL